MIFSWEDRNLDHIAKHGVSPVESMDVVEGASRPYPQSDGGDKWRVHGPTRGGRWLQVIYVLRSLTTIDLSTVDPADRLCVEEDGVVAYVIHARDLTVPERRAARKRRGAR